MKKIDKLVCAPHFYTMEGEGVGYRANAAMAVDCGKILEVGPRDDLFSRYLPEEVIELQSSAAFPGFIDGHMHTACNIMRGLAQDTNSWMMFGLQPFDNAVNDEERDAGSRVAILEAIRAGTTTLGDYESKMENVCAFIEKVGARGNIAQTIRAAKRRVYKPGELYEFDDDMGEESLNRNLALYDAWNGESKRPHQNSLWPPGRRFCQSRNAFEDPKGRKRARLQDPHARTAGGTVRHIRSSSVTASGLRSFWIPWDTWMSP